MTSPMHLFRKALLTVVFLAASALLLAVPASAQVPWSNPQLFFHTVLTSNQAQINIPSIPNSHSTLRMHLRGQSTDTNTASNASYIRAQLNSNLDIYSYGFTYWAYSSSSGTSQAHNVQNGAVIGQIPDSASTTDPDGSGAMTCTWVGYSQATWDHVGFCDSTVSTYNSASGLARLISSMVWRPSSPAAINQITLSLTDGSSFEVGTIVDLYLE